MRTLALVLALAACKHSPPADCGKKAAEVASFLRAADHGGQIFQLAPIVPPLRDDLTMRPVPAPAISIGPDSITYQGQLIDNAGDLASRLRATHDQIAGDLAKGNYYPKSRPPDPELIAIIADQTAPMASVAMALGVADSTGFKNVMFVFRHTPTTPPPRTAIDDDIDKLLAGDGAQRATAIASYTAKKIDACPALKKSFGAVSAVEDDKAKFLIDSIEPSLKDCGCAVDPYTVRTIMWRILAEAEPAVVVRVRLDHRAIPLYGATWGEASKQLTPATTRVWFN